MKVINYFDSERQSYWLNEIKKGDWGVEQLKQFGYEAPETTKSEMEDKICSFQI